MDRVGIAPKTSHFDNPPTDNWFRTVTERMNIYTGSSDPTTAMIPQNQWVLYKNISTGECRLWLNDTNSLKWVALDSTSYTAAWTSYTPTVSSGTGSFTTLGTVTGRYRLIGKTLFLSGSVSITTNGTAASSVIVSLPPGLTSASTQVITGRENSVTGNMLQGITGIGYSTISLFTYANAYPGGNGYTLVFTGVIEVS